MLDNGYAALRGASAMSTEITVPEDGDYELSFDWSRAPLFGRLRVLIGPDAQHLSEVGSLIDIDDDETDETVNRCGYLTWNRRCFRVNALTAGKWTLMFRNDAEGTTNMRAYSFFDNVAMKKLPADNLVCELPGGDFECMTTNLAFSSELKASERTFGPAYTLDDWGCAQPAGKWAVGPATRGMLSTNNAPATKQYFGYYSYLLERCDRPGHAQLVMGNTNGFARKTVALPAGTWKLMADIVPFHKTDDMGAVLKQYRYTAILNATVTVGTGSATSLGEIRAEGARAKFDLAWDASFDVPAGGTNVTIKLQTTSEHSGVVVDNLRLVKVTSGTGNLVSDGEFDATASAWRTLRNGYVADATSPFSRVRASVDGTVAVNPSEYTYCTPHHDGATSGRFAYVSDCGTVCQEIEFPSAGLYRLVYYTRSRHNGQSSIAPMAYGRNRLLAYAAADGVTNAIDIALVDTTNWVQHSAIFKVTSAGSASFGFRGLNVPESAAVLDGADEPGYDKTAFFDGISIEKLPVETASDPVSLPDDLAVKVSAGAKLQLGFDGTVDVKSVRFGSRSVLGPVNAQTCPDYVIGPGTLNATSKPGLVILFR